MSYHAWKQHERDTAKALLGKRIPRGANFSRSLPDVVADSIHTLKLPGTIFAECKYSANMPWLNKYKTKIYNENFKVFPVANSDRLLFFDIENISSLLILHTYADDIVISIPDYILDYLQQSQKYVSKTLSSPLDCITIKSLSDIDIQHKPVLPIVCLRTKKDSTILAYTYQSFLSNYLNSTNDKNKRNVQ